MGLIKFQKFDSCCCCWSVRTGTLLIGWIELIVIPLLMTGLVIWKSITDTQDNVTVFIVNVVLIGAILSTSSILLLVGVYQNKSWLVVLYLLASLIATVLLAASTAPDKNDGVDVVYVWKLGGYCTWLYLLLVVYSFYIEIKNGPRYNPVEDIV